MYPDFGDCEISLEFNSLDQWVAWLKENPWASDPLFISSCVEAIKRNGIIDPLFGYTAREEISVEHLNYRESLVAHGINSRARGVMRILTDEILCKGTALKLYAPEHFTALASILRKLLDFQGSEFLPDSKMRLQYPEVQHQDVMALTYEAASFDAYMSCEIMEHVPNIARKLSEAHRVLKPGGLFFGTFPFAYMNEDGVEKAKLADGELIHLMAPEYHGNPADPASGSLVFTIPGWSFLKDARAAGFQSTVMNFMVSRRHGVLGSEIAGVFIFKARRG